MVKAQQLTRLTFVDEENRLNVDLEGTLLEWPKGRIIHIEEPLH